jgi:hypothetical protein
MTNFVTDRARADDHRCGRRRSQGRHRGHAARGERNRQDESKKGKNGGSDGGLQQDGRRPIDREGGTRTVELSLDS